MTLSVREAQCDLPSDEIVRRLLGEISPGSVVLAVDFLPGSYSNYTHLVNARSASGSTFRLVVRRYAVFGSYDRGEKARREFKTLELLQEHGIPAPRPLLLDENGAVLGTPGIVTDYIPGEQVLSPSDVPSWARSMATMLAEIHSVPCDAGAKSYLLDANSEASWFLRSGTVPDYMNSHPDGAQVWQAAHDPWSCMQPASAGLVHIDYWSGNILWDTGRIVAVVDWEEAAYGDAGIDVAYCRMDMILSGLGKVADQFLQVYEGVMGRRVENLALWELAASARPMLHAQGWIDESPSRERFNGFIADARRRAGF